jgi:ABC-2 type transport system permease protein
MGFPLLWAGVRGAILLVALALLEGPVHWAGFPLALVATLVTVLAYAGVGLMAAALILAFRTAGPLVQAVMAVSSLLGGVYYSTTVIPEPFDVLPLFIPLTYGLRLVRRTLLEGTPLSGLVGDSLALGILTLGLLALGSMAFWAALRHSRRNGSLGQY